MYVAHYIDNEWKLNKRIISFKIINAPHNGKNIASLINDEIIDFDIRDKIFTITLDNASNNDATIVIDGNASILSLGCKINKKLNFYIIKSLILLKTGV